MNNLNEMGLVELDNTSLKEQNGGLIMVYPELAIGIVKAIIEPIQGAYEAGHDAGENNCDCQ